MMDCFFEIADKKIKITAPDFIPETDYASLFLSQGGKPDISVACSVAEKCPRPDMPYLGRADDFEVFSDGKKIQRLFSGATDFTVLSTFDTDYKGHSEVIVTEKNYDVIMNSGYLFGIISLSQLLLRSGTLFLHASFIEYNGKAILFSAPSGTGKSTQARLWEKYRGAEIINGDKCAINLKNGTAYAHGVPFSGTSGICKNRSVPLAAVVLLSQAQTDSVERLKGIKAVTGIISNVHLDFVDPNEHSLAVLALADILALVPVYSFACTKEKNAVDTLFDHLCKAGDIVADQV